MTREQYWRAQMRRIAVLLAIWGAVAFGLAIFGAPSLNAVSLGGIPLGFWWAQQGSIFVFVLLILAYAILSDRADRRAGLDEEAEPPPADAH